MDKTTYTKTRQSIRDNGMRYTAAHAIDVGDVATLELCNALSGIDQQTDALQQRVTWQQRNINKTIAFKLTTSINLGE